MCSIDFNTYDYDENRTEIVVEHDRRRNEIMSRMPIQSRSYHVIKAHPGVFCLL